MEPNVIISIVGFITTIVVTVLNQRGAARASMLDRQEKAEEVKAQAEEVKAQLVLASQIAQLQSDLAFQNQSDDLKQSIATSKSDIQADLAKNTDISVKAFEEANHVNTKISSLQEVLISEQRKLIEGNKI